MLNDLQFLERNVIGRDGEHAGEFDHDSSGFLDADNHPFDPLERSFDYSDFLAFAEFLGNLFQEEDLIRHGEADMNEICHCLVGNNDGFSGGFIPYETGWICLSERVHERPEFGIGSPYKTEVRYGRNCDCQLLAVALDLLATHGYKSLKASLIETGLKL